VRFWPLEKFCNLLRLSLQDYVSNGTRTTRMLRVLLVLVAGCLLCKAKLSVFLRSVSPHSFRFLELKWGPHSIDRFADEHSHLLPRFDSMFWNPFCEAMDAFTRSWDLDNNWVCPPPHLVSRTLRHMRSCCAQGTLIVPLWRSAPFWPLLTTNGSHLAHFVEDWVDLLPLKTTFCMGRHSSGVFGRENLNFRVLAVRINFRSARFFVTGFCISDQGWCCQSSVFICLVW